ncbi:MAG: hypothetical protein ACK4G3_06320, partial [bacterium]
YQKIFPHPAIFPYLLQRFSFITDYFFTASGGIKNYFLQYKAMFFCREQNRKNSNSSRKKFQRNWKEG